MRAVDGTRSVSDMTTEVHDHVAWLRSQATSLRTLIPQQWRDGERELATSNTGYCLEYMLAFAALDAVDAAGCAERLASLDAETLFREYLPIAGQDIVNAHEIDLVAIPVLLGDVPLALAYLRRRLVPARCTKFWMEYVRALSCLADGMPYVEAKLTPKGIEKHWRAYLPYLAARSTGDDPSDAIAEIGRSFEKTNRDRRIWNDGTFDPSGNRPVAWDCRLAYLAAFADGVASYGAENAHAP
jgi:hypothetical protein